MTSSSSPQPLPDRAKLDAAGCPTEVERQLAVADAELPPQPAPPIDFVALASIRTRRRLGITLAGAMAVFAALMTSTPPALDDSVADPDRAALAVRQSTIQAAAALARRLEALRASWASSERADSARSRERSCRVVIRERLATARADAAMTIAQTPTPSIDNDSNRTIR